MIGVSWAQNFQLPENSVGVMPAGGAPNFQMPRNFMRAMPMRGVPNPMQEMARGTNFTR